MRNIADLKIETDIIPLFDFTFNEHAKNVLSQLFSSAEISLEEILARQQIITGFIKNWKFLDSFSYSKIDFNETYSFLNNIGNDYIGKETNPIKQRLHLHFSTNKQQQTSAKISQFIVLMSRIETHYFSLINLNHFPAFFATKLNTIRDFLATFNLKKQCDKIHSNQFGIKETLEINNLLNDKRRAIAIEPFWEAFFLFEAYLSITKAMVKYHFALPTFTEQNFSITEFYHPLLKEPIKNSLVSTGTVILLTGPNMCGKSTLLKSVGLCVYLAHLGVGVPAKECSIPFFDGVSVSINLNDDLNKGYSHFLTEIKALKSVLLEINQGRRCFAIFDEMFRGTNVDDALAILQRTVTGISQFKTSFFIISTHLHHLKNSIDLNRNVEPLFIESNLKNGKPVFTYKLQSGWSDLKIGQIIFDAEDLGKLLLEK